MFQYAFAKAYARKVGAKLEISMDWIGRKIFEIDDMPISKKLNKTPEDWVPTNQVNIDLFGYFQKQECLNLYSKNDVKKWFNIRDEYLNAVPEINKYYIAAHLRRGDYISKFSNVYCIVSEQSYLHACDKFNLDRDKIIWFKEEKPHNNSKLDSSLCFLEDFINIMRANVILRANSSFSWWASALSDEEKTQVYSPLVEDKKGQKDVEFVKGNWPCMWSVKNNKMGKYVKHGNLYLR